MKLFNFFRPASSAPVARERLQILLEYERKLGSHVDLIAVLREEILEVLSRHVTVDPDKVQIRSTAALTSRRSPSTSRSRTHPPGCGRGPDCEALKGASRRRKEDVTRYRLERKSAAEGPSKALLSFRIPGAGSLPAGISRRGARGPIRSHAPPGAPRQRRMRPKCTRDCRRLLGRLLSWHSRRAPGLRRRTARREQRRDISCPCSFFVVRHGIAVHVSRGRRLCRYGRFAQDLRNSKNPQHAEQKFRPRRR